MAYVSAEAGLQQEFDDRCAEYHLPMEQRDWSGGSSSTNGPAARTNIVLSNDGAFEMLRKSFNDVGTGFSQEQQVWQSYEVDREPTLHACTMPVDPDGDVQQTKVNDAIKPLLSQHEETVDAEGFQHAVIVTDDPETAIAQLEAIHRARHETYSFVSVSPSDISIAESGEPKEEPQWRKEEPSQRQEGELIPQSINESNTVLRQSDTRPLDLPAPEGMIFLVGCRPSNRDKPITKEQQETSLAKLSDLLQRYGEVEAQVSVNANTTTAIPELHEQSSACGPARSDPIPTTNNMETPNTTTTQDRDTSSIRSPPLRKDSIFQIAETPSSRKRMIDYSPESPESLPDLTIIDLTEDSDNPVESPSKRRKCTPSTSSGTPQQVPGWRRKKTKQQKLEEIQRASLPAQVPEVQEIVRLLNERIGHPTQLPLIVQFVQKSFERFDEETAATAIKKLLKIAEKCEEGLRSFRELVRHLERYGTLPIGSVEI